jgi:ferritin-like protein
MSDFVYMIVIIHGMVEEVMQFPREDAHVAEQQFVNAMAERISNFDDYTDGDIQACLEDGFEGFGGGDCSIQLHWSDG